jgi:hypothetical protein
MANLGAPVINLGAPVGSIIEFGGFRVAFFSACYHKFFLQPLSPFFYFLLGCIASVLELSAVFLTPSVNCEAESSEM